MKRRRTIGVVGLVAAGIAVALLLGEGLLWAVSPSEYMYPRYQFSPEYGLIPFPNVVMVHGIPRRFEYRYTINEYQCRGVTPEPGPAALPAVIVLGDSYAFGMGVSDGEEFPAILQNELAGRFEVVNLGSPGWGLTQEIRRFYEFGSRYEPDIVVLQYCSNDPDDNLANRVTVVEGDGFAFLESTNSLNWIKKYLSKSFVQRTQLYNFLRVRASRALLPRHVEQEAARLQPSPGAQDTGESGPTAQETVYIELLGTFARRLHAQGRRLVMISVDRQLAASPHIESAVFDLEKRNYLDYVEVLDWLDGLPSYQSPEGHVWGTVAHAEIGKGLARVLSGATSSADSIPDPSSQ